MEIWIQIPETCVMISNYGNAKSCGRLNTNINGVKRYVKSRPYKFTIDKDGYLSFSVHYPSGQKKEILHRLIASHFIPNPNNLPQINHKNGVKHDNRVENLEWCTCSHNNKHAYKNGLVKNVSESHYKAKLKNKDIDPIKRLYHKGIMNMREIADLYSVSKSTIQKIIRNQSWKWIKNKTN